MTPAPHTVVIELAASRPRLSDCTSRHRGSAHQGARAAARSDARCAWKTCTATPAGVPILRLAVWGRVLPARVEREPCTASRSESLDPLQHHHHHNDHRRHTASTYIGERIGEHLIRDQ
jgi:hypothetical protein